VEKNDGCVDKMMNFVNKTEMQKHLPEDLLSKVTILLQDSGYVTISPIELTRYEWRQFNEKVKRMGGLWISAGAHAHWSVPWSEKRSRERYIY
jgi:hypothetical protein